MAAKKPENFSRKMLTSQAKSGILTLALFGQSPFGGIAQLARARGSYPRCPRFKSRCRYHAADVLQHGPLVKWLRHRPFTAVTRVRVSYGSPTPYGERHQGQTWRHSSAGRALASHARGHRFEFCCLHQKTPSKPLVLTVFSFLSNFLGGFLKISNGFLTGGIFLSVTWQ